MLPRAARLKRNRDFRAVYARGKSFSTPALTLYVRPRARGEPAGAASRLGFVISKKAARRAHDRNRLKRRLREICRRSLLPRLGPGRAVDALFVARASALDADFA